jgi:hypothetical protein
MLHKAVIDMCCHLGVLMLLTCLCCLSAICHAATAGYNLLTVLGAEERTPTL